MGRHSRLFLAILTQLSLVWVLLTTTSCGPAAEKLVDKAAREKILLKGNGSEPRSLDPHLVQTTTEHHLMCALFEGLVDDHHSDDTQVTPGVAERWESFENGARWIFHLRTNAKWSDGVPLTAADFVQSYERQLSPTFGALYADMLYKLKNAEAFHRGKLADFSQVGVKALGPHTLELTLNGPMPYFPFVLTHFTWFPVPLHCISKYGSEIPGIQDEPNPVQAGIESRFNLWTRPGKMVGNGAFHLKDWAFKDYVEVTRNPHYWDAAKVKLNGVKFVVVTDLATEDRLFRNGRLHVTETLPLPRIAHYQKSAPSILQLRPYLGSYFFRLNVKEGPLGDPRVRRALNLAVDRESLVNKTLHAAHSPAETFIPPMAGYPMRPTLKFDPTEAKRLLAEAGFPEGKGMPKLSIHVNDSESHVLIAEALQNAWKTQLGLDFSIRQESSSVFYDTQQRLDYQISRAGWIADFVEPISFLDMWTTGNANNNTGWGSEKYDQLIRDSYTEPTTEARLAILQKAEDILMTELPIVPIYWYRRPFLLHPAVKGWDNKVLDNHPLKYVDLGSEKLPPMN